MRKNHFILAAVVALFLISAGYYFLWSPNEDSVSLEFTEVSLESTPLPYFDIQQAGEIIIEHTIDGITQIMYSAANDEVFSYLIINNEYYDLGKVNYNNAYLEASLLTATNINSPAPIFKWVEIFGANGAITHYITINDDIPNRLAYIDGFAQEVDLDDDGNVESVVSQGTIAETFIYVWSVENQILSHANLNHDLASDAVYYLDSQNVFEAYKNNTTTLYKYRKGMLQQVK